MQVWLKRFQNLNVADIIFVVDVVAITGTTGCLKKIVWRLIKIL